MLTKYKGWSHSFLKGFFTNILEDDILSSKTAFVYGFINFFPIIELSYIRLKIYI